MRVGDGLKAEEEAAGWRGERPLDSVIEKSFKSAGGGKSLARAWEFEVGLAGLTEQTLTGTLLNLGSPEEPFSVRPLTSDIGEPQHSTTATLI